MRRKDSTNLNGAHAEAQFITYALEQGWEVAHPFIKSSAYDSLIRRAPDVPWETVQIKRAYYAIRTSRPTKCLVIKLRRNTGTKMMPYKDGDFDWLFCYHEHGRWLMPWDLLRGKRSSIHIGSPLYDLWKV